MRISDWSSDVCSSDLSRLALAIIAKAPCFEDRGCANTGKRRVQIGPVVDAGPGRGTAAQTADEALFRLPILSDFQRLHRWMHSCPLVQCRERGMNNIFKLVSEIGRAYVCTPVTNAHPV